MSESRLSPAEAAALERVILANPDANNARLAAIFGAEVGRAVCAATIRRRLEARLTGKGLDRMPTTDITRGRFGPPGHRWPDHPRLTREEERDLARRRDAGSLEARDRLIESNLKLAAKFAGDFARKYPAYRRDDADSDAVMGLIRAAEKFDPDFGCAFSTYAMRWIFDHLQRTYRGTKYPVALPVHAEAWERLDREGRKPKSRGVSPSVAADIRAIFRARVVGSSSRSGSPSPLDGIPCRKAEDPGEAVDRAALPEHVERLLARLDARSAEVVARRFGLRGHEPQKFRQIAQALGLTKERVRQIQKNALARLRDAALEREAVA